MPPTRKKRKKVHSVPPDAWPAKSKAPEPAVVPASAGWASLTPELIATLGKFLDLPMPRPPPPAAKQDGGKGKGGADDAPAKFSCCLTHKRICALSRAPSATEQLAGKSASSSKSSSSTDGVHIVIWEEHKMRYRGTSSQCTDLMPAALESAIKEVGHGVTLASAKKFDSKS